MTNSFRIEESELAEWHAALAKRSDLRGVPAIAKEMEAHRMRKEADGTVIVTRHQLFTWTEALQGAAARANAPDLERVVHEMRSVLTGKPAAAAPTPARAEPAPPRALAAPATPAPSIYAPPPAVQYGAPATTTTAPGLRPRVLTGPDLANTARDLIRSATRELSVSSPWNTGIETLHADIITLPPTVRVLLLSRRPEKEDATYHQMMDQLGRRKAITAWSPHIQTRMIIQDDDRALLGAASNPGPNSREIGILITDREAVAALRAQFEKNHVEAAGGRY